MYFFSLGKIFLSGKKFFVRDKNYFVQDKNCFVRDKNSFVRAEGWGISALSISSFPKTNQRFGVNEPI